MEGLYQRFCKLSIFHSFLRSLCVLCLTAVLSVVLYPGLWAIGGRLHAALTGSPVPGRHSLLLVSSPTEQVARDIGRALMERHMAASIHILPRTMSLYYWKGEIQDASETVMLVKTKTSKVQEVVDYVRSIHPYDNPDVVSLTLDYSSAPFLRWLDAAVPGD